MTADAFREIACVELLLAKPASNITNNYDFLLRLGIRTSSTGTLTVL